MRVRITFLPKCTKNAILPLDHHPFQALIYHSVAEAAPEYANALHQQGYGSEFSSKRFRLFVFSRCYLPDPQVRQASRVKDGHLVFPPGPVEWEVCSPMPDFIQAFVGGLAMKQSVTIRDSYAAQHLDIAEMAIIEPPRFIERMFFHTISPITVSTTDQNPDGSPGKHYVRAGDERFGPLVRINLIEKFRALAGCDPLDSSLHFEFDRDYIRNAAE